jgi:ATP/maltotriose-dependent transcriptional regulator MalT
MVTNLSSLKRHLESVAELIGKASIALDKEGKVHPSKIDRARWEALFSLIDDAKDDLDKSWDYVEQFVNYDEQLNATATIQAALSEPEAEEGDF